MKFCTECGNKLPDFAKFCNKCGAKQEVVEEVVEEKPEEPVEEEAQVLAEAPTEEPVEEEALVEEAAEEAPVEEVTEDAPLEEPVEEEAEEALVEEATEEAPVEEVTEETPLEEPIEEVPTPEPVVEEAKEDSIEEAKKEMRAELEAEKERMRKELLAELKAQQKENANNAPAQSTPTVVAAPPLQNTQNNPNQNLTPAQRYQYLLKNDEKFSGLLKAGRGRDLFGLANLLFIVVWLVCSLMPILVLTGTNAVANFSGETYPIYLNGITLDFYAGTAEAAGYAFCPNSGLTGIGSLIVFIAGFLFLAAIILLAVLPTKKGYVLDTYEKNGAEGLARALGGIKNFFGLLFSIFVMSPYVANYVGALDLDYGGDKYIYGELFVIPENFMIGLMISIISIVIMLAFAIISTVVFKKRIKKYLK